MRRFAPIALAAALLGWTALAQAPVVYDDAGETREALQQALAGREAAAARSEVLEAQARQTEDEAERTARQAAALAARIQQAEAGIAAARARSTLVSREQARLQAELGREQRPIVSLTAALQQFARRPVVLGLLRPGEIRDLVYLRAVMAEAVPQVQQRTVSLRRKIDRTQQLALAARQAATVLQQEQAALAQRRQQLAALETRQRLASRAVGSSANREAERALALAEQARDLDSLVDEMEQAATLRAKLAALPGPVLRPGSGGAGEDGPALAAPSASASAPASAPAPYIMPVTGRTLAGFGAEIDGTLSQGLTLAPAANAQVVAPAAGRVAYAGPYRGYGQIVIVEHPGGWTSLVTGLARSDVAVGAELVGGAPIGVAGPGRPTITLELRRGGQPVNPLDLTR
ncbi:murein hydrolase activator EnvC family protein [Alteraurantiacibacter buctensis]|uniref:Peptidoglycan DD-metalloendopeptidase family protein n=1 Tax=Alteraurantiacibacter buctensis TaxID=1503981 RepID=A0A844YQD2_9SPHN|nr:peptidoglycan DD-metalloendopeptidase family protein [Alteraurantiacibacter buctensis]MXO70565.1 peptidoglycan DD-metalloendopeptidase family protein [Alteraurantiacibacter buctensis]